MSADACATCAQTYDTPSEKPLFPGRTLPCCNRTICARCLNQNKRFETYCPYCQISTAPSSLPQGLRDPPAYSSLETENVSARGTSDDEALPPPYYQAGNYSGNGNTSDEKGGAAAPADDVLHFVAPGDSMRSLALAYDVPVAALRKTNNIYSDHLIQARKTLLIPGEYYKGGVSLSPRPLESEEEEIKKNKVRRWMVACKVAE
jgi:LysM repeat protein